MSRPITQIVAIFALTSPAFAIRIATPVRMVPQTGAIGSVGAVGAALAAPRTLIAPSLGNSIRLNHSLPSLKTPALNLSAPISAMNSPLKAVVPTVAAEASAAKKFEAANMHQAAAMSTEMTALEKSKNTSAAPLMRKVFDNGVGAATQRDVLGVAAPERFRASGGARWGRMLHRDHQFRPEGVPSPEGKNPKQSGWKRSGWWKAAKAVAAAGGGLFLGSKAADFAYAFTLAQAGVYGLAGLAAAAGLAAWGLRKLSKKRGAQIFYSTLLGTFLLNAGGNLIADAFGIGLMSFAIAFPVAFLALLWAAGVGLKRN